MTLPEEVQKQIGTEVAYRKAGKEITRGTVMDARFSDTVILNKKSGKTFKGVQLKIKPVDGFNANRAFWTTTFPTKIEIK